MAHAGACLLSSLCLLKAALMNLGTSSKPLKPNEMVGRHSVAVTVLHCTASIPGPIYFPTVQIQTGEKSNCEVSQKSCQSAGNQFSPCSMSGTLRRHSMFQSSLAEDCYWELQPSTVLSRYRKLNTFEDSLEKVIPLFTVPFLSFQPAIA